MATFKLRYTTSELLKVKERRSLIHYYWTYNNSEYTFYFIDNRRLPCYNPNGLMRIACHKANFYRLRNKIKLLPFRLFLVSKWFHLYTFDLVPDSVFLNEGSSDRLNQLNEQYDGKLIVNVVVI